MSFCIPFEVLETLGNEPEPLCKQQLNQAGSDNLGVLHPRGPLWIYRVVRNLTVLIHIGVADGAIVRALRAHYPVLIGYRLQIVYQIRVISVFGLVVLLRVGPDLIVDIVTNSGLFEHRYLLLFPLFQDSDIYSDPPEPHLEHPSQLLWLLLTSSSLVLYHRKDCPSVRADVFTRSPQVRGEFFISCSCCIYMIGFIQCWTLTVKSVLSVLSTLTMHFLFIGSRCVRTIHRSYFCGARKDLRGDSSGVVFCRWQSRLCGSYASFIVSSGVSKS